MRSVLTVLVVVFALGSVALPPRSARAAGRFVTSDATKPLMQTGEEILFVVDKGQITMHVKLRCSGPPGDFGWLLPLPSMPTDHKGMPGIDIGSEELFAELEPPA